jgi:hypothetical protein
VHTLFGLFLLPTPPPTTSRQNLFCPCL